MKKIFSFLLLTVAMATVAMFTSCGDDDDSTTTVYMGTYTVTVTDPNGEMADSPSDFAKLQSYMTACDCNIHELTAEGAKSRLKKCAENTLSKMQTLIKENAWLAKSSIKVTSTVKGVSGMESSTSITFKEVAESM